MYQTVDKKTEAFEPTELMRFIQNKQEKIWIDYHTDTFMVENIVKDKTIFNHTITLNFSKN